VQLWV